jgi:hypothetical protein
MNLIAENSQERSQLSQRGASVRMNTRDNDSYHSPTRDLNNPNGMVEMQVHIPKIRISKYFKTKYQGAYIPPSQANQNKDNSATKQGLNLA